jgi:4-hydroxybenzoate polyprenyltransferase
MMTHLAGKAMPWKAYIRIIRPVNLLIMAVMLLLVRYCIFLPVFAENRLEGLMPDWQFLLLVLATVLIAAGGYVINDVLDIELDRVNKPGKQVVGRMISEETGNKLHINLTGAGVLIGLAFGYLSGNVFLGIIFIIIATALFYYSFKYKYMPALGNLVVALLASMVVIIYWLFEFYNLKSQPESFIAASTSFWQLNRFVLAFALFAFLTTFIREVIKDAQDIEGDARFGCRTLPVLMGTKNLRYLLIPLELIVVTLLGWYHLALHHAGYHLMSLLLILPAIILIYAIARTVKAGDKASFAHLSLVLKIVMVSGMLSLAATWFRNL